MEKPDWNAIEADFLATGLRYGKLAEKWGVSLSTLKKKAMRGKWGEKYARITKQTEEPALPEEAKTHLAPAEFEAIDPGDLARELRSQRSRRMIETTDALMDRIIDALELIPPDNTYALSTLVKALKDLREMQGLNKSALDIEEQRARIDKLRSETRTAETGGSGGVIILPAVSEELRPPDG